MASSYLETNPVPPDVATILDDEDLAFFLQQEEIEKAQRYEQNAKKRPAFDSDSSSSSLFGIPRLPPSPDTVRNSTDQDQPRFNSNRPFRPPQSLNRQTSFQGSTLYRLGSNANSSAPSRNIDPVSLSIDPQDISYIIVDDVDDEPPSASVPVVDDDVVAKDHLFAQALQQEEMKKLNDRLRYQRLHSNSNSHFASSFDDDSQLRQASAASLRTSGAATASSTSLLSRNRASSSRTRTNGSREDRLLNFALNEADLFSAAVDPQDVPANANAPRRFDSTLNFLADQRHRNNPPAPTTGRRRAGPSSSSLFRQLALTDGDFSSNDYETLLSLDEAVNKKKGLSREEWERLPSFTFKSSTLNDSSETKECSVCFESFQSREKVTALVCTHKFHHKCIKPWLKENRRCPLCQKDAATGQ